MLDVELTAELARKNLAVGTWTSPKGEAHVSLTRMGRYNKNIAIPVTLLPQVIEALQEQAKELQ